jgi:two-component system NtrC family sensor kinase
VSPTAEEIEARAQRALRERPSVSIRTRLMIGFFLFVVLAVGAAVTSRVILSRVEKRLEFLVAADRYTSEVQEARRFEKNYFLYRQDRDGVSYLQQAGQHLANARDILAQNENELLTVVGQGKLLTMRQDLARYAELLAELQHLDQDRHVHEDEPPAGELRRHGTKMVTFAQDLSADERAKLNAEMRRLHQVPWALLLVMLIMAVAVASSLARQILRPLNRLMQTTQRIAQGDFTPLMPTRRYRDEFSEVNMAINTMMHELHRRQELMVQSHKLRAVGTLTAGVAHELNNPLNNIMLTAASLQEDYTGLSDDERLDMVNDLLEQAERSQRIVRNLLDFARESERTSERLHLPGLVGDAIRLAHNRITLHKARLETRLLENLPPIHGDRQQLIQVFLNLILNALDAVDGMDRQGIIDISAQPADEPRMVALHFRDNGKGIPEHILPLIFDPFFTTKRTGKGTGLGLSVSLGIVRDHGGDIRATSRAGDGSTFTVLLPIAQTPAPQRQDAETCRPRPPVSSGDESDRMP